MPLRPFTVEGIVVGWVDANRARRLADFPGVFRVSTREVELQPRLADVASRTSVMAEVAKALAAEGALTAWRDEHYAVAPALGAPPWFLLERAAARYFGIRTWAAHVNGLVHRNGEVWMWLARRSPTKAIDPGLLDNLVGGGIAAGMTVAATVEKEAREEAGIAAALALHAQAQGTVSIFRAQPDGIQRETVFVHDLELPATFTPSNQDGEVVEQRLVPHAEAIRLIAQEIGDRPQFPVGNWDLSPISPHADGPDTVTADASLVIIDCLFRHGALRADTTAGAALAALRNPRWGR